MPDLDDQGNPVVKRGIGQARSASEVADVEMPHFWVEVKRHRKVNIRAAMLQATTATMAASGEYRIPLVVSKDDTTGLPGQVDTRPALVTLYLEDWLNILREWWPIRGGKR